MTYIEYRRHDRNTLLVEAANKSQMKFIRSLGGVYTTKLKGWLVGRECENKLEAYNDKVLKRNEKSLHRARSTSYSDVTSVEEESSGSDRSGRTDDDDDLHSSSGEESDVIPSPSPSPRPASRRQTSRDIHGSPPTLEKKYRQIEDRLSRLESRSLIPVSPIHKVRIPSSPTLRRRKVKDLA